MIVNDAPDINLACGTAVSSVRFTGETPVPQFVSQFERESEPAQRPWPCAD